MNLCFIIGKVITEVEFNFVCNKKIISVANCKIVLKNKSVIKIYGYNEIADYLYSKVKENKIIFIQGILTENGIEINKIKILD